MCFGNEQEQIKAISLRGIESKGTVNWRKDSASNLVILNLSGTKFTLQKNFNICFYSLQFLNLSNNPFLPLSLVSDYHFPKLKELLYSLNNLGLHSYPNLLYSLPSPLKLLDLSHNHLSTLPFTPHAGLLVLKPKWESDDPLSWRGVPQPAHTHDWRWRNERNVVFRKFQGACIQCVQTHQTALVVSLQWGTRRIALVDWG
jgi:hypothetical protein